MALDGFGVCYDVNVRPKPRASAYNLIVFTAFSRPPPMYYVVTDYTRWASPKIFQNFSLTVSFSLSFVAIPAPFRFWSRTPSRRPSDWLAANIISFHCAYTRIHFINFNKYDESVRACMRVLRDNFGASRMKLTSPPPPPRTLHTMHPHREVTHPPSRPSHRLRRAARHILFGRHHTRWPTNKI